MKRTYKKSSKPKRENNKIENHNIYVPIIFIGSLSFILIMTLFN